MTQSDDLTLSGHELAVRSTIDALIETATTYDVETLEQIYHDDLSVTMLSESWEVQQADKATFTELFRSKRDAGDPPMNTWAEFHHISAANDTAHVLVSRKNDLSGEERLLTLSIDLVFEDLRWQVIREVIVIGART